MEVTKVFYFSDGTAFYKKNFNFINLAHHEEDFGFPAELHFFRFLMGRDLVMVLKAS